MAAEQRFFVAPLALIPQHGLLAASGAIVPGADSEMIGGFTGHRRRAHRYGSSMDPELSTADLARRIDRLEARAGIAETLYRYAYNVCHGLYEQNGQLFTEDAVFVSRDGSLGQLADAPVRSRLEGRQAILAFLVRSAGSAGGVCPMIHNILIELRGDGEATSDCMMTGFVPASSTTFVGVYRDSFRLEDRWRFTSRMHTIILGGNLR